MKVNFDNLPRYEVQCRNLHTGKWEHAVTCNPEYKATVQRRSCFLFFRRCVTVVLNLEEADTQARTNALKHARSYHNRPVRLRRESRVLRRFQRGNITWFTTIWANGRFLEPSETD